MSRMTIYISAGFSGEKIKTLLESSAVVSMGEIYHLKESDRRRFIPRFVCGVDAE